MANTPRDLLPWVESRLHVALQHYGNVHRGSGHGSFISTRLYEHARDVVLDYLGLGGDHVVIFATPWRLRGLLGQLPKRARARVLSSQDFGLPVGVRALVVRRSALPKGPPPAPGGGTVRMVSEGSVDWAGAPDRFEPGTPNITGVIAFAAALAKAKQNNVFQMQAQPMVAQAPGDDLSGLRGAALLRALRSQLIGRDVLVPVAEGHEPAINFDHGASTSTFEPIWQAVRQAWQKDQAGQQATVMATRTTVHRFFGAPAADYDVVFASNTSEAISLAATGLATLVKPGSVVLNTTFEHNSNELPWRFLPGVTLARLPVDRDGFINLAHLESVLRAHNIERRFGERRIELVCVCGASNVLGTCNDLAAMALLVHSHGARLLVDAAQLASHRRIRMGDDGIDLLAFSGHKMYAPFGSGGLVARKGLLSWPAQDEPLVLASGEENVAGIAALGKAMELMERIGMDEIARKEKAITRYALARLATIPGLRIHGMSDYEDRRLAHKSGVICFELAGVPHNRLAQLLAERGGIATRSGCFCVNMFVKQLLGIGRLKNGLARTGLTLLPHTTQGLLAGLVRVSFGLTSRPSEVDRLVDVLQQIASEKPRRFERVLARHHFGAPVLPTSPTRRRIEGMAQDRVRQILG